MLDDFFTVAELKDGLTCPDRVKDLMILMQREKDCVVENVRDAPTQWDTAANIIAITKNQDCLDLFVELDGLWFISRWLKDAYKFRNESGIRDSSLKLLTALDKLPMDDSRLVHSGILARVLDFLDHDDSGVYEKAKALCDKWMPNSKQKHETNSVSSSSNDDEKLAQQFGDEMEREVDSRNGKESLVIGGSNNLDSSRPGPGPKAMDVKDCETNFGSVSKVVQESEANTERCCSGFDLNQEGSEEIERPVDLVATPISVVSASRGDKLPSLQFEGNLGWKGPTSAFQHVAGCGTPINPKQHSDLDIDLNVAEANEDKIDGYSSGNKTPILSGIPSREESSIGASPRRSVRLHLDLNSLGDGNIDNVVLNQNGRRAESAISLFGIEVEEAILQPRKGRMSEPALELSLGGSNGSCGVGYGPLGAPTPYMVDPRGGVPPQFVGPSLVQPAAPGQEPPAFLMNMDAGGSQHSNMDLNYGLMMNDNYDEGKSSWVVGGKRQEPDGGWNGFSGDYKHQQPPWK
ncbi:hypothetical protein L6452_13858 [Arctium lappa]|uniref:Uncharacterized protein n=1 Tax=Arctium lappa TaxID=4217 RepID=A0ACB9CJN2_ARCLA|nr:hypothetical protein L6452_13858 [Arctium lappa]